MIPPYTFVSREGEHISILTMDEEGVRILSLDLSKNRGKED